MGLYGSLVLLAASVAAISVVDAMGIHFRSCEIGLLAFGGLMGVAVNLGWLH